MAATALAMGQAEAEVKARLQMQLAIHSRLASQESDPAGVATGPLAATFPVQFHPPVGVQCIQLQHKLWQVQDAAALRPLIQECPSCPAEWSSLNVVKALQLLKKYPLPEPFDWRGLKRRAGVLLDAATTALRNGKGCAPEKVQLPDIGDPTALMHEVLFHPRTVGLFVHALAKLGGHLVLFQKAASFLARWLEKTSTGLGPQDMVNIVWAFSLQGSEALRESQLFVRLAAHFEACFEDAGGEYSPHFFSSVFSYLGKIAAVIRAQTSSEPQWGKRLVPKASQYALQKLESFKPKELSAVVASFGQFASAEECRPFLLEVLAMLSIPEQIQRFPMQEAVCLAEQFYSFIEGTPSDSQAPAGLRLTPEVLEGHTELCTAVQRLLRTITEVAVERLSELQPLHLSSMMRTLAKARVSHEPLWTAVLQRGTAKLRPGAGAEPPWSPQEVVEVLSGIAALFERHTLSSPLPPQSLSDEKLNAGLVTFVRAMGNVLPGRLDGLGPEDVTKMTRCLGILADGCPAMRRKLHNTRLRLREAAASALSCNSLGELSLPAFGELVVGFAKLNTDLDGVQGLLSRIASELKAVTAESTVTGKALLLAPLLWAVAVHGAGMGHQPPLLKHGLSATVFSFASAFCSTVQKTLDEPDKGMDVGTPLLGEDAFSKPDPEEQRDREGCEHAPGQQEKPSEGAPWPLEEEKCGIASSAASLWPRAADVAQVLWSLAALARTEGGSEVLRAAPLGQLVQELGQGAHAGNMLLAGCTRTEFGDVLWALGRLRVNAGPALQAVIAATCEADTDYWVGETLQGQVFLGRLLWGAAVLTASNPPEALLAAAKRIAVRLPEMGRGQPDADSFIALLWALVALNAAGPAELADALVDGLSVKPKVGADNVMVSLNPTGTWEWSLLWELLALAAPRTWPAQWRVNTRNAWEQERLIATKMLGQDVHRVLDAALANARIDAKINANVPAKQGSHSADAWPALRGIAVDAGLAERQWCVELTSVQELQPLDAASMESAEGLAIAMLKHGRERAIKWRLLHTRGWSVVCLPITTLKRDAKDLYGTIGRALQNGGNPPLIPITLAPEDMAESRACSSPADEGDVRLGRMPVKEPLAADRETLGVAALADELLSLPPPASSSLSPSPVFDAVAPGPESSSVQREKAEPSPSPSPCRRSPSVAGLAGQAPPVVDASTVPTLEVHTANSPRRWSFAQYLKSPENGGMPWDQWDLPESGGLLQEQLHALESSHRPQREQHALAQARAGGGSPAQTVSLAGVMARAYGGSPAQPAGAANFAGMARADGGSPAPTAGLAGVTDFASLVARAEGGGAANAADAASLASTVRADSDSPAQPARVVNFASMAGAYGGGPAQPTGVSNFASVARAYGGGPAQPATHCASAARAYGGGPAQPTGVTNFASVVGRPAFPSALDVRLRPHLGTEVGIGSLGSGACAAAPPLLFATLPPAPPPASHLQHAPAAPPAPQPMLGLCKQGADAEEEQSTLAAPRLSAGGQPEGLPRGDFWGTEGAHTRSRNRNLRSVPGQRKLKLTTSTPPLAAVQASRVTLKARPLPKSAGTHVNDSQPRLLLKSERSGPVKCEVAADDARPAARPDARVAGGTGSRLNRSTQEQMVEAPHARWKRPTALTGRSRAAGATPSAEVPTTPASAVERQGPAESRAAPAPEEHDWLVQVELCHGAKKKRLQLRSSVTVGELIEQYGRVVKGKGEVILTDSQGLEHGRDITVSMLEDEARNLGAAAFPVKLELRLDDW